MFRINSRQIFIGLGVLGWIVAAFLAWSLKEATRPSAGVVDASRILIKNNYIRVPEYRVVKVSVPIEGATGIASGQGGFGYENPKPDPRPDSDPCWKPTEGDLKADCEWDLQRDATGAWLSMTAVAGVQTPWGEVVKRKKLKPEEMKAEISSDVGKALRVVPWRLDTRIEASIESDPKLSFGTSIYGKGRWGGSFSYDYPLQGSSERAVWKVGVARSFGRR